MKPIISLQNKVKYESQRRAHVRYRAKRSMEYQQWSVWTVGLEYSALVLQSAREELITSWRIRFPEPKGTKLLDRELFFCSPHSVST